MSDLCRTDACLLAPGFAASRRSHARHGFTLLEMLIVVAVITALIALLIPTINMGREASRRAQCLSNERHITLATLAYANENQGRFFLDGRDVFSDFSPNNIRISAYQAMGFGDPTVDIPGRNYWLCPSNPNFYAGLNNGTCWPADGFGAPWPAGDSAWCNPTLGNADASGWIKCSYVYLGNGLGKPATPSYDPNYAARPVRIGQPGTVGAMFTDRVEYWAANNPSSLWTINHPASLSVGMAAAGSNETFGDGHGEWVSTLPAPLVLGANEGAAYSSVDPYWANWWW